ncbi:MAG: aminotransferase class V-fold PLP-dependent enzyme [Tetrasphaera sp.]
MTGDSMRHTDDGAPLTDILSGLEALRAHDVPVHGGRTLAYVYDAGVGAADEAGRAALAAFGATNGLDPTAFPSIGAMEQDLIAVATRLLHGPGTTVGVATSGGTESILLAVLAARDAAAPAGPAAERPSMVLPDTAHAAFRKAGHYLGVRPVLVPVDPATFRADPVAMAAAIDETTVLVVASAPSYAHGVVDPVAPIAAAAAAAGVRCHVDACIGGWVLPFLDEPETPRWDFAVDGVTSISVDLHKYGYTPKGLALLLHRTPQLRRTHLFATADWPGYTMLNTTVQSTKSGGPVAAGWAVAQALGIDGYRALALQAREATRAIAEGVSDIPGVRVLAEPDTTLLALASDHSCDVYTVADEMAARGWLVQPQLPYAASPASLHLSVAAATAPLVTELLAALGEAVSAAQAAGPVGADPALAAALAAIDPGRIDDAALDGLLAAAGLTGAEGLTLPQRMAPVNALLDSAPPRVREQLLLGVLDRLTRRR